jgi:hypothetical protein
LGDRRGFKFIEKVVAKQKTLDKNLQKADIMNKDNDYKKRPLQRFGIVNKNSDADQGALLFGKGGSHAQGSLHD